MMPFYQFCFGFIQRRRKIFKSNAKLCKCNANDMQVLCKTMPRKAKKRKAKQSKVKKIKTNKIKTNKIKTNKIKYSHIFLI